ncbi:MAG: hypothetical protein JWN41_1523 [Thermoleophilia bacterium]|nr:hypothetical protein [Thermoleophilia bacterium]
MSSDDDIDDVWDKLTDAPDPGEAGPYQGADGGAEPEAEEIEIVAVGAPVRVTLVIHADRVPVVPWAQGWRVGAIGPDEDGDITLICEHEIDRSPVAQLSAVTGLLGSIKGAQLELRWWAIQTRAPLPGEHPPEPTLDEELADLLDEQDD